jgi:transposase-like protein
VRNSAKRDVAAAAYAEKKRKALELRKAGATYEQIAQSIGLADPSNARRTVQAAIKDIYAEPAAEVLAIELARLDAMLLGIYSKAKAGEVSAIDRVLKIMDRRAAYLGIDAPKESILTANVANATPAEARKIMSELFGEVTPSASGGDEVTPPAGPAEE